MTPKAREGNRRRVARWRKKHREHYNAYMRELRKRRKLDK
jgi:ferric-dicitrate binding protein FerR (iron transport regulator)